MKKSMLSVCLLLAVAAAGAATDAKKSCRSAAANARFCADTPAVVTSATLQELREMAADLGFEPTDDKDTAGDPSMELTMGKLKVGFIFYGELKENPEKVTSIALQLNLNMQAQADPGLCNEWNERERYTKAYCKGTKYTLESDLDLEGGITWRAVSRFLLSFRSAVDAFAKHVQFH